MLQSLYTASSGLKIQQQNIDQIANNISNINTTGFKASRMDFKDAIYQAMKEGENNLRQGYGVLIDSTVRLFVQGASVDTGRTLDLAIDGNGFFAVENNNGEILFTRDGIFDTTEIEGNSYLVTKDGKFILDSNFERITLNCRAEEVKINAKGEISAQDQQLATIGVFEFTNVNGLEAVGSNKYAATANSGEPVPSGSTVKQGSYEASSVDMATEITRLIKAQKAYSVISRVISTTDEMQSMANNIRA